jgi:protein required for attachment to host cells
MAIHGDTPLPGAAGSRRDKSLSDKLKEGAVSARIYKITIFASAQVLGELLKQTEEVAKKLIGETHAIDLTALPMHDLNKRFRKEFSV